MLSAALSLFRNYFLFWNGLSLCGGRGIRGGIFRALIEVIYVAALMLPDKVAGSDEPVYCISACGFRKSGALLYCFRGEGQVIAIFVACQN